MRIGNLPLRTASRTGTEEGASLDTGNPESARLAIHGGSPVAALMT